MQITRRVVPAFDPLQAGTIQRCGICGATVVPDPVEWRLFEGASNASNVPQSFVCEPCADRWHKEEWKPLTLAGALALIPAIIGAGSTWVAAVVDPEGPNGSVIRLAVNARTGVCIQARGRTWSKSNVPVHRAAFEIRRMLLELGRVDYNARTGCGNLPPRHPDIPAKTYAAAIQMMTRICDDVAFAEGDAKP